MTIPVGARVTYSDMDPANPELIGTIVEPTAEDLAHVMTTDYPTRPDRGGVLVCWDETETWDASWQLPEDLIVLT